LIRDEVPNCTLQTLARHLRSRHRPTHRALDDALATTEVFHSLLERAGTLGVLGLDDLVVLPTVGAHPQFGKLRMTNRLPRAPGVYIFRDGGRRPLYVGKAVDLRRRVRSYFTGDTRRKVGGLLRELASIDHIQCRSALEASVLEVRLIHELTPRYNRVTKHWRGYSYVKLTLDEAWPRLSVVRQPRRGDGCLYLGPVGSGRTARLIVEAIETAVPLRRCSVRLPVAPRELRPGPCSAAQLGVASCPCAGTVDRAAYAAIVAKVVAGLTEAPLLLLGPLAERIRRLAAERRFEEAADLRDRAAALARAVERQRRHDAVRRAGRLEVEVETGVAVLIDRGLLRSEGALPFDVDGAGPPDQPVPRHLVDELAVVTAWLDRSAARIVQCESGLAWPAVRLPTFEPRQPRETRERRTAKAAKAASTASPGR
jgi:DNA polymerase-3 subunit epsilon